MPALKIPTVFKSSFLSGDGTISVRGNENLLQFLYKSNQPFSKEIAHGQDKLLVLDLNAAPAKDVKIGDHDSLALKIQAGTTVAAYLDIIWHDEDRSLLKAYNLEKYINEDTMYLLFRFDGNASFAAKLAQQWSSYGLSGKFGVETGGEVHYAYLRPFRITGHTSRNVLKEYFGNLRLPQNVDKIENIPIPGEVLSLTYGGYLTATAIASWGYSVSKTAEFEFNKLAIRNKVHIEAKAAICPYYRLAGNFEIQVRRARDDDKNWARVTVKKNRARLFEIPADLTLGVKSETPDLPDGPQQFLEALLDIRAPNLINQIVKYIELTPQQFVSAMKKKVDGLTGHFVNTLTQKWLNKPLEKIESNKEINEFYNFIMKVKETYDNLGERVVGFIEDHIDESGIEDRLIKTLEDATSNLRNAMGLQKITNHKIWQFIRTHVDNDWIDLIENNDKAFDKLKAKINKFKAVKLDALKKFIEVKKQSLNLDHLFNELQILNPAEIENNVNRHLTELASRLTGKELDKLSEKELASTLKDAKKQVARLIKFKNKLYAQFKQALNRSYELSIAYGYRHARQNEALIDVEINLDAIETTIAGEVIPGGSRLMKEALSGNFNNVLRYAAPDRVNILKGLFTHKINRSSQLTINLFGWNYSHIHQLITNTEHSIEQKDNGVLHIYGIDVESIEQRKRRGEEIEVNLAFNVISRGFQPTGSDLAEVLDSISAMSSCYQLRINDPVTTRQELLDYLQFADYLRLIPDEYAGRVIAVESEENIESSVLRIEGYLEEISKELSNGDGPGFGKVTVSYRLRYDAEALMQIFKSSLNLEFHAREALRTITAFTYQQFHPFHEIAEIYPEKVMYQYWKSQGLQTNVPGSLEYKIGSSNKKIVLSQHNRLLLEVLYGVEDSFIKSLLKLDKILKSVAVKKRKPKAADLEKILTKFVGFQPKLNKWFGFGGRAVIHPFLAVLNRLITEATGGRAWTTTLEMKFQQNDKLVTKFLIS